MNPCDPMAVAVDWLDASRDASPEQIPATYSPDGVIECACGGDKIIQAAKALSVDIAEDGLITHSRRGPV